MYLDIGTLIGITIGLTTSVALLITTLLQNVRLTEQREYWYYQYMELKHFYDYE